MEKIKLDASIYTAVAQHYIASPNFYGMDNPLPVRSGFISGDTDVVDLPSIPPRTAAKADRTIHRKVGEALTMATFDQVVEWASDNAPGEGQRHKYWAAIAGCLYRFGVDPEEISEIVYEGASAASDKEATSRAACALRACDAIALGQAMTGIPTLVEEFKVDGLDRIQTLLGANKISLDELVARLSKASTPDDIEIVLQEVATLQDVARDFILKTIKEKTGIGTTALASRVQKIEKENKKDSGNIDVADMVSELALKKFYDGGENLIRIDRQSFFYNGMKWHEEHDDYTGKNILSVTQEVSNNAPALITNQANVVRDARMLTCLKSAGRGDPLRRLEMHHPVINARNAEIWFEKDGSFSVLPHHRDSFQMVQIGVDYMPNAVPVRFKKALQEIFAKSTDSEEMVRHFFEVIGNVVVPIRDYAGFMLWKGQSNCGKSKLLETLIRLVGQESVLSISLGSLADDRDAIGNLLGKLLVVDDDVDQGTVFPAGNIKRLSEDKYVTGEKKYQNKFSFYNSAFPAMVTNHWPILKSADPSIERRAIVIPFNRSFTVGVDDDRDLFPQIWNDPLEMSGILNEAIAGFQRLRQRGAYKHPVDCVNAYREWVSGSAFFPVFLGEVCHPNVDGPNQPWHEFYKRFRQWADHYGIKNHLSSSALKAAYEGLGFRLSSTDGYMTVKGWYAPEPPM